MPSGSRRDGAACREQAVAEHQARQTPLSPMSARTLRPGWIAFAIVRHGVVSTHGSSPQLFCWLSAHREACFADIELLGGELGTRSRRLAGNRRRAVGAALQVHGNRVAGDTPAG